MLPEERLLRYWADGNAGGGAIVAQDDNSKTVTQSIKYFIYFPFVY